MMVLNFGVISEFSSANTAIVATGLVSVAC